MVKEDKGEETRRDQKRIVMEKQKGKGKGREKKERGSEEKGA